MLAEALKTDVDADVRLAAACALGDTKNAAGDRRVGRGTKRLGSGHAISSHLVAQADHGQESWQQHRAVATIRQGRAARESRRRWPSACANCFKTRNSMNHGCFALAPRGEKP